MISAVLHASLMPFLHYIIHVTLLHRLHRQFVCCDIMEVAQMVGDITSDVPWGKTHKTLTPCKAEFEQ